MGVRAERSGETNPFGDVLLFGAFVPIGTLIALTHTPLTTHTDLLPIVWAGIVVSATAGIGLWSEIPSSALLLGGVVGLGSGWLFASWAFDLGLPVVLAALGAASIAFGASLVYVSRLYRGVEATGRMGVWRYLFLALGAIPFGVLFLR
ncbi:hypothetical protein [Natronosalvus vescus]|uniref:hypothetical protein n=1 Tax=Natronosalvus vescus TaxID=2953881 RepID=UPI0020915991|nr:hypothetical protein [Natronosalvus vescus]